MGACEGCEVFVTKLQLDRAGEISTLAQSPANHFAEPHQSGMESIEFGRVFVVSMLMADGLGIGVLTDFAVEPAAGVFAACFAREGQSPFSEALFQVAVFEAGQIADALDSHFVQFLLGDFTDAGNIADVEWRQKLRFLRRQHPKHTVRFRLCGSDFGDEPGRPNADRAVQLRRGFHRFMEAMRRA